MVSMMVMWGFSLSLIKVLETVAHLVFAKAWSKDVWGF
jgi:hypothetical protein